MANVAINGMGRIGRAALKIALDTPGIEVVAVNDIVPLENLVYLLRFDTVYGRYDRRVEAGDGELTVGDQSIRFLSEKDPAALPWQEMDVDLVLECTGLFTRRDDLKKHLDAGAKLALLSAPAKGEGVPTVVPGVNQLENSPRMASCASCTTNCIAPIVEIIGRRIGLAKATMTTIHAYTSSQMIVDGPSKKVRRGRAAAANLVPTSTGAATAATQVLTQYAGRFDGVAVRVPVPVGSVADIVFLTSRPTSVEEVNGILQEEAGSERYRGVVGVSEDPLVSSDIVGDSRASIVDAEMTQVVDGDLVKVMSWYDNEWGYSAQLVRQAVAMVQVAEPAAT